MDPFLHEWAELYFREDTGRYVVFAVLSRRGTSTQVAWDRAGEASQEALKLVLERFEHRQMNFREYKDFARFVTRQAIWCATEEYRRWWRRRQELPDNEAPAPRADPTLDDLREARFQLSAEDQEILRLRYEEGLKLKDMGDHLGVSAPTACRRVQAAKDHLRALL
jgi:RNA polymerase sigma factor (sigma-70 family)